MLNEKIRENKKKETIHVFIKKAKKSPTFNKCRTLFVLNSQVSFIVEEISKRRKNNNHY